MRSLSSPNPNSTYIRGRINLFSSSPPTCHFLSSWLLVIATPYVARLQVQRITRPRSANLSFGHTRLAFTPFSTKNCEIITYQEIYHSVSTVHQQCSLVQHSAANCVEKIRLEDIQKMDVLDVSFTLHSEFHHYHYHFKSIHFPCILLIPLYPVDYHDKSVLTLFSLSLIIFQSCLLHVTPNVIENPLPHLPLLHFSITTNIFPTIMIFTNLLLNDYHSHHVLN